MSNEPRQAPRPDQDDDNDGFEPYDLDGVTVEGINAEWKSKDESNPDNDRSST